MTDEVHVVSRRNTVIMTETNGTAGQHVAAADGVQPGEVLWSHPDPQSTQMWHFIQEANQKHSLDLKTYHDLYQWSIENIADFWSATWKHVGIQASNTTDLKVGGKCSSYRQ